MALQQVAKATTTQTVTVDIAPKVRRRLLTELKSYAELKAQRDAIDEAMSAHKETIGQLRESTGETALSLEGFKVSLVSPTRKVLDHKKLVELGCAIAWIEESTKIVPTKAYEKITLPGGRDDEY